MDEDLIWASLFLGLGTLLFITSFLFLVYVYNLVCYLKNHLADPFRTISDIFASVYEVKDEEPQFLCGLFWWWCRMRVRKVDKHFRFRNFVLGIGSIVALMVAANVMAFLAYNEVKELTWIVVVVVESLINVASLMLLYPIQFNTDVADIRNLDAWFCYDSINHSTSWSCCFSTCQPRLCCSWWCQCSTSFADLHGWGSIMFFVVNPIFNMILNVIKYVHPGRSVFLVRFYLVLTFLYFLVVVVSVSFLRSICLGPAVNNETKVGGEVLSEDEKVFWNKLRGFDDPMDAAGRNGVKRSSDVEMGHSTNKATGAPETKDPKDAAEDQRAQTVNPVLQQGIKNTAIGGSAGVVISDASDSETGSKEREPPSSNVNVGAGGYLVYLELFCICLIILTNMADLVVQFREID